MLKSLKYEIKRFLQENIKGYILISAVFLSGIALSYILNASYGSEEEIRIYLEDFLSSVKNYSIVPDKVFSTALIGYIKEIVILFLLSLSVVGTPGVLVVIFLKGISYGVVMIVTTKILGAKSVLLFMALIIPHAILLVPCFLLYSSHCIKNAYQILIGTKDIKSRILAPLLYGGATVAVASVASLIQAYFEPLLVRAVF